MLSSRLEFVKEIKMNQTTRRTRISSKKKKERKEKGRQRAHVVVVVVVVVRRTCERRANRWALNDVRQSVICK